MLSSDLPSVVAATGGFFPVYRSNKFGDMWYVHLEDIFTAVPIGSTPFCIAILTNCGETPKADAASLIDTLSIGSIPLFQPSFSEDLPRAFHA